MKNKLFLFFGVNILTLPFTFFSVNSLFSIQYEGSENSKSYIIVIVISALIFYYLFFERLISRSFLAKDLLLVILPILIIINALFANIFLGVSTEKFVYQFFLLVMPALFFGMELGRNDYLSSSGNFLFLVALIISVSVLFLIPKMLFIPTNELMTFFGGGQYQAFSYSVSFSFLVSLIYYLFYLKNKSILINIFFIILFLVQISGVALSGGRGGAGLVIIGLLIILFNKFSVVRVFKIFINIISVLLIFISLLYFNFSDYSDRIFESLGRIFSFLNDGTIDFTKTSNRDLVYSETIVLISKEPIFGFGIFGYLNKTDGGYPHNFFLEILLQGGILFLIFWCIAFFFFIIKLINLINVDKHKYLLATFIYSFVLLMFSATYLLEPFFWFNLSYVITSSSNNNRINN